MAIDQTPYYQIANILLPGYPFCTSFRPCPVLVTLKTGTPTISLYNYSPPPFLVIMFFAPLSVLLLHSFTLLAAHPLSPRANNLVPTVNPTAYLPDGGAGTYPRLAHLADGSVLGTVTTSSQGTAVLTVTRSTDGARTFSAWGTIASSTGDLDNTYVQQLANGDVVATFRNHDKNAAGAYTFYRVRIRSRVFYLRINNVNH
jgi:hypothetical protein